MMAANPLHQVAATTLLTAAAVAAGRLTTTSRLTAAGGLAATSWLASRLATTSRLAAASGLTTTGWFTAVAVGPMVTEKTSLRNSTETQQESGRKTTQVECTTHGVSLLDTSKRETDESVIRR